MTATLTPTADRLARWISLAESALPHGPDWLAPVRTAALACFAERGFPTLRDEDWRQTSLAPIVNRDFVPAVTDGAALSREQVERLRLTDDAEPLLVFVNGRFAPQLSSSPDLPAGVVCANLAALAQSHPKIRQHLARHAPYQTSALAALNTVLFEHVAFVWVPPDTAVGTTLHLLHVSSPRPEPTVMAPRSLIVVDERSALTLIEDYVALGEGAYLNNAVTELVVGPGAAVRHCRVVREAQAAYHLGGLHVQQHSGSRLAAHSVVLSGALVRNDVHTWLDGEGAECHLDGLSLLSGDQHGDHHLRVEHRSPQCASREAFRAVLGDRARGVFCGRIVVHPGAQKTDAKQTNMNLLLSREAQATSQPQLEIFADDVKCTHGATTGQADEEAIFYLRSRGIGADAARNLLVYAFANAALQSIQPDALRTGLERLVRARLPHHVSVEE